MHGQNHIKFISSNLVITAVNVTFIKM